MGRNSRPAYLPTWTATVGAMLDAQAGPESCAVTVTCNSCGISRDVDLAAIVAKRGRDFTLVNKRARCKLTHGCRGWNRFFYQRGVMRPLWTEETALDWIDIDHAARVREWETRKYMADLIAGRIIRTDPAPIGIDQTLWSLCDDRERKQLIRRARG